MLYVRINTNQGFFCYDKDGRIEKMQFRFPRPISGIGVDVQFNKVLQNVVFPRLLNPNEIVYLGSQHFRARLVVRHPSSYTPSLITSIYPRETNADLPEADCLVIAEERLYPVTGEKNEYWYVYRPFSFAESKETLNLLLCVHAWTLNGIAQFREYYFEESGDVCACFPPNKRPDWGSVWQLDDECAFMSLDL